MLLPGTAAPARPRLADKLRERDRAVKVPGGSSASPPASASPPCPVTPSTPTSWSALADRALYAAKAGGRDRVAVAGEEPSVTAVSG